MAERRPIRVLLIDPSLRVRRILTAALADQPDIEIVGEAGDADGALEQIARLHPDVLTLDGEMPRTGRLRFLKKLIGLYRLRVIVISAVTPGAGTAAIGDWAAGAVDVLAKPRATHADREFLQALISKIRAAAMRGVAAAQPDAGGMLQEIPVSLVAIGASTGGTVAIERVVAGLASDSPPIAIVQHIPAAFSRAFAARLDRLCGMRVREAGHGDPCERGQILIAPGDCHLRLVRSGGLIRACLEKGAPVCFQRPSVDVLFASIADLAMERAVGVLLTGMGHDGAAGLLAMRRSGAHTIVQDERSCAVFGMPRAAIRAGAAAEVLPLDRIALRLAAHS